MEAFRHATSSRCKTDVLEIDLHETLDGVAVVCHDPNLQRLCGRDIEVSQVNFCDLPALRPELQVMSEPDGVTSAPTDPQSGRNIVRLVELFDSIPGVVFNIDLKENSPQFADQVAKVIFKKDMRLRVIWGSDKSSSLATYLTEKYPDIPQFFGTNSVLKTVLFYWIGILPFVTLSESFFQPPSSWAYCLRNHKTLRTTSWSEWLKYQVVTILLMQKTLFRHLSDRGIPVWLWVINHEDGFQQAFNDFGVDAVMTDYPERLRNYLNS